MIAGSVFVSVTPTGFDSVVLQPMSLQSAAVHVCAPFAVPQVDQTVAALPVTTVTGAPNATVSRKNCTAGAPEVSPDPVT